MQFNQQVIWWIRISPICLALLLQPIWTTTMASTSDKKPSDRHSITNIITADKKIPSNPKVIINGFTTTPGNKPPSIALQKSLLSSYQQKQKHYDIRTEHINSDGSPKYINRLIFENSPYLLQHAHNPVNWYAWRKAAFEAARRDNKPLFLSIGYSTCHWCHVMERESFDNEEIAEMLNQHFISIKIDREEHPDIDEIYMTGVQLMNGRGGWPMTVFLTHDAKPFFSGTYFPPHQFKDVLARLSAAWQDNPEYLQQYAQKVSDKIRIITANKSSAEAFKQETILKAIDQMMNSYDKDYGGFSSAPKFPRETSLLLLIDQLQRQHNQRHFDALIKTLDSMAQGGIYDQVGGGFHRYSTDKFWLAPHFEKMLYNQAQLARVYAHAYELTGLHRYRRVTQQTLDYVLRDMLSADGGFFSATDADSEGEEGLFFLWHTAEVKKTLSADQSELTIKAFGMTDKGNFEHSNILHLPVSLEQYAQQHKLAVSNLYEKVDIIREQLYQQREKRIHPLRDDKIITAWNAMMITGFVDSSQILANTHYLDAAIKAADYLWQYNRDKHNQLFRISLHKQASIPATQEDYAYFSEALIHLYDATSNRQWLDKSILIMEQMISNFWDKEQGGFFNSRKESTTPIIARPKSLSDGAIASGNSVALKALIMLNKRINDLQYATKINQTIKAFSKIIQKYPASYTYTMLGLNEFYNGSIAKRQYAANGSIQSTISYHKAKNKTIKFTVDLNIDDDWHINSTKPGMDKLIPTSISIKDKQHYQIKSINYPQGKNKEIKLFGKTLSIYEHHVQISGEIAKKKDSIKATDTIPSLELQLQACNKQECLAPEKLVFLF